MSVPGFSVASLASPAPSLSSFPEFLAPSVAEVATNSVSRLSSPAADGLSHSVSEPPPPPYGFSQTVPPGMVTRLPPSALDELRPFMAAYRPEAQDGKDGSDAMQALLQQATAVAPGLMARLGGLGSRAPLLAVALSVSSASPGAVHPLYDSLQSTASLLLHAQSSHQLQAAYAQPPLQQLWAELQIFMQLVLAAMRRDGELSELWTDRRHQPELSAIQSRLQAAEQRLRLALSWDSNHVVHRMEDEVKQTRHEVKETRQAVSQLSASISPPHAAPAAPVIDQQAYAEAVKRACMRLGGVMDALERGVVGSSAVGLQDVFVAQRVGLLEGCSFVSELMRAAAQTEQPRTTGQLELRSPAARQRGQYAAAEQPASTVMTFLGHAKLRWTVILGDPGSGKSSALRAHLLAWAAASPAERERLDFPILVELKKYAYARDKHHASTLLQYMSGGGEARTPLDIAALQAMLQPSSGRRVLLLLDGLDEVFDVRLRAQVVEDVQRFVNQHRSAAVRVVLTSRIVGYCVRELQADDFTHCVLQPLDEEQISEFVTRWHAAVYTEAEAETRRRMEKQLLEGLRSSGPLVQLASCPLLLSMIVALNRSGELPTQRASLYAECSRLLLEQWKTEEAVQAVRDMAGMSITLFTRAHKEALLADLAWRMQQQDSTGLTNLVPQDVLEAVVLQHVKRRRLRQAEPELVMQALITQLRERHHVICWLGGHSFAFVHRTFLEYYAALHVQQQWEAGRMSQAQLVELFRQAREDDCEVLELLSGMLPSQRIYPCLETLLERRAHGFKLLLAARCLAQLQERDEAAAVERAIRQQLEASSARHAGLRRIMILAQLWPDARTRGLLEEIVNRPGDTRRGAAVEALVARWADDRTRALLSSLLSLPWEDGYQHRDRLLAQPYRRSSVGIHLPAYALAEACPDECTRALLEDAVSTDSHAADTAIEMLAKHWIDGRSRALLETVAGSPSACAETAVRALCGASEWRDEAVRVLLEGIARSDADRAAKAAVVQLASRWQDDRTRAVLEGMAVSSSSEAALAAMGMLSERWKDERTRGLLELIASSDRSWPAAVALGALVKEWGCSPEELQTAGYWQGKGLTDDAGERVRETVLMAGGAEEVTRLHWFYTVAVLRE